MTSSPGLENENNGGDGEDYIIGDNGRILRKIVDVGETFPWDHNIVWETFPVPFETEVIRDVRLFDDVDMVEVRNLTGI